MKKTNLRLPAVLAFAAAFTLIVSGCTWRTCKCEVAPVKGVAAGEGGAETESVYHSLTQEQAKARMDSGDDIIILDVRTQEEFDAGHIANALLLPNEDIGAEMPPELPDKDAEILIYCRSGNRSAQAAEKLAGMGYTAVYDFGGINTWTYGIVTE